MNEMPDLLQAAKPLLPPFVGVLFGVAARWSREAKAGRVKSWKRLLLDLPTLGALTVATGNLAARMSADPMTAAGLGVAVGYVGMEALNAFIAWRFPRATSEQGRP